MTQASRSNAARVFRATPKALVLALVLACAACSTDEPSNDPDPGEAKPIVVEVSPDEEFSVSLPDGTTISGPAGSVSQAGEVTVTPSSYTAPDGSPVLTKNLHGFDLTHPGELLQPITVSFPAPPRPPAGETGALDEAHVMPAAAHIDAEGRWTYEKVNWRDGRFELTTTDFSSWAPTWFDPVGWLKSVFDEAGRIITGTTEPPDCKNATMSWAQLQVDSPLTHSCLKDNKDPSGASRAEVFVKSNRKSYIHLSYPGGEEYKWRGNADSLMGVAIEWFAGTDNPVLLGGGEEMSIGYARPPLDQQHAISAYIDLKTMGLSFVTEILNLVVPDDGGRANLAALWAVKTCGAKIPATISVDTVWSLLECVVVDTLPQLTDDKKAVAAAYSIWGNGAKDYTEQGRKQLTNTAHKVKMLGHVFKAVGLVQILQNAIRHIVDGADEAVNGRGSLTLDLTAGSLSTADLSNTFVPAGSCTDGPTSGWGGSQGIQLGDGQGEQQQDDGGWVSVLETQVLGWSDFDSDNVPEVAMLLRCAGSPIDSCCAGQTSLMWYLNIFDVNEGKLARVGAPLSGQDVIPGGPASTMITDGSLSGNTVVTTETIPYADSFTSAELGGMDPYTEIVTAWTMNPDHEWVGQRQ